MTFNGARWVARCLESLAAQTLQPLEVLVFDNGSSDGSASLIAATDDVSLVRVHLHPTNIGYAAAHNRNIDVARGRYILLLNQDVELEPRFLEMAVRALEARPSAGACQGRLFRLAAPGVRDDRLDSTGLRFLRDRRVVSRDQMRRSCEVQRPAGPVWGADGPAPVYRTAALEECRVRRLSGGSEVLDEDFFAYKEDVDLAWRLRRLGWSAWYEPEAIAWHARGASAHGGTSFLSVARSNRSIDLRIKRLSWRNHRLMLIKNETAEGLARDWPWVARREILSLLFMIVADPRRLTAVWALMRAMPSAARKRRLIDRVSRARALDRSKRRVSG